MEWVAMVGRTIGQVLLPDRRGISKSVRLSKRVQTRDASTKNAETTYPDGSNSVSEMGDDDLRLPICNFVLEIIIAFN